MGDVATNENIVVVDEDNRGRHDEEITIDDPKEIGQNIESTTDNIDVLGDSVLPQRDASLIPQR